MPNWKKVIVSGSSAVLTSVTATAGFTGSLSGSALTAISSSFATTASYVNTLNQNVLITGSLTVGASSAGASENTITLGARDTSNEGGQIGFNAPGGTYTSASFIDNWQNKARILKGNNTTSTGLIAQWDIHTTQMQLAGYTAASSFPGTATANLAVDSGGNVITVSTTGGSVFPYVGNAVITGSLTTTGVIYAQPNGGMYFQGGDDAALYDINVSNHMGIYGVQDSTVGAIKLGSSGPVLYGSGSRLGLGTTNPSSASLTINGNVWATSFTGSLLGTSSYATQATNAFTASYVLNAQTASYVQNAVSASYVLNAVSASYATIALNASMATSASYSVNSTTAATASYVLNAVSASYALNATSASYARTASYAANLTISGSINNVDYIDFDTNNIIGTNEPAWKEGRVFYDSGSGALAVYNWEQDITLNVGQESWLRARNQTGVTITNGSVVRLSSAIGDRPTVVLAQSTDQTNTFSTTNEIVGIATHDIETGTDGFITTFGIVNGLNTSAFTAGDLLWVSQSAGRFTNVAPPPPFDRTFVGIVTRANPSNGSVFTTPLTPIHFHDISSVSSSVYQQGDLWMYRSGSAGLANAWINTKQLTGSYSISGSLTATSLTGSHLGTSSYATQATSAYTASYVLNAVSASYALTAGSTAAVAGTINYVPKFTSGTTIGNSQIFDNGTNVGIGTTSPAAKVHISGTGAVQRLESNGTFTALDFYNTTAAANSRNWSIGSNLYNYGDFNIMNSVSSGSAPTSANTYLTINKDGKVGVNTTAPIYNLDIAASATSDGLRITQGGTSKIIAYGDGVINWGAAADYGTLTWDSGKSIVKGLSGKALSLGANNVNDQLYITTAGNVGINTTTPNSKLQVVGDTSISGSLITSASSGNGINTSTTTLTAGPYTTVDWGAGQLKDDNSIATVDWYSGYTLTAPSYGGVATVQWGAGRLNSLSTSMSIDWENRTANDANEVASIDWGTRALNDSSAWTVLDWENKALYDSTGVGSMDWEHRTLYDASGVNSVGWDNRILYDSSGVGSINWESRFLASATSAVKILDWSSDYWLSSPAYQKDDKNIALQEAVSTTAGTTDTYLGDIIQGRITTGYSGYPSNGQLCCLYNGYWIQYDQSDTNLYGLMVGIVFDVDTGNETCNVLLEGHVLIDSSSFTYPQVANADFGLPVYIKQNTSDGQMDTQTPSGNGAGIVQVMGHCYYQNTSTSSNWMMKFKPATDWYTI